MLRAALTVWLLMATVAFAATDDSTTSPSLSAPLRSIPASMPRKTARDESLQLRGADSEISVGLADKAAVPSVFDELSPKNSPTPQNAQLLLKRNLLDDVTLTYKSNVGMANTAPSQNGSVTTQAARNQSTSEIGWNVTDQWSVTGSNQMDQIFEFQRAEPSRVRDGIETRYRLNSGTSFGLGVNNEDYYSNNLSTFERHTSTGQIQQKLGNLPLNWTASPSLITETSALDASQNRSGSRVDQSLLWNIDPNLSWNVGTGWANWNYDLDAHTQLDRTVYSQWTRQIRSNYKLTFRTDVQTIDTAQENTTAQREDKFKLSVGQQLLFTDDLSAAFDLRQEYQREINSTWAPVDHSATLSIQKKF